MMHNPLNEGHCQCLNRVLERTPQYIELAQNCLDCGWDVQQYLDRLREQQEMATKAKATFFPNHP